MKIVGYILAGIFIIACATLVGFILYYGWFFGVAIIAGAKSLEPNIYVPLVVTVLTASIGLTATLYTQSRTRTREIESAHRDRKVEIYLEFLKFIETALLSAKPELGGVPIDTNDLAKKLFEFRTKAVLWGSPGVLREVSKLTKLNPEIKTEVFDILEVIQREMRKDIGLSNRGLETDFFAKLPLNDPESLDLLRNTERSTQA